MQLDKITLVTNDLAVVRRFYAQVLQLPVCAASATEVTFQAGRSQLCFVAGAAAGFYHFAFLIPCNQLKQAFEWVAAKTTVLPFSDNSAVADFKNWNAQAFYFHDAAQNIVEFIAHHDLQNDSDAPFSAASLLAVCEIGVPVHSVPHACDFFHSTYHIPYFKKGPRLPDFAVMGDEEGLLIVTTIGRGWLPTQQPAEPHELRIDLTYNRTAITLDGSRLQH